ncbi:hypothetical protein AGMMS50218_04100 [Actinomycetota bacterium]|nr:hypothetical protein AGMMS50218_04100 [Actinomycetota bacterium]
MRNVVAAPSLFGALTLVVALVTGGAATADLLVIDRVVTDERAYLDAGGDLVRASVRDGSIDAAACAAVAHLDGVTAASAVSVRQARLLGRPEHTQTVLLATSGIEQMVGLPALGGGQVLVSQIVADRWVWRAGTPVQLVPDGTAQGGWDVPTAMLEVGGVADLSRFGDAASTAIVVPAAATGAADECLVQSVPAALDDVAAALPALLGDSEDTPVDVQRQVYTGAFGPDAALDFASRPTRAAGLAAGTVVGVLLALVAWTRRQRSALYATLGMPWAGGVVLRVTESLIPVAVGAAWGGLCAALVGTALGLPPRTAVVTAGLQVLAAAGTAVVLVVLTSLWRPPTLQALKDR